MEQLKQLLDNMFKTRKLDSYTHHEGNKGVISIRFEGLFRSHVESQSEDQNTPLDNHVTFKRKTKGQLNRDLDRSKGLIKRHNTRSQNRNVEIEHPRYSDHMDNILMSNLSPEAAIFQPMFTSDSDDIIPFSSPVVESQHNTQEETIGASMHEEGSSVLPDYSAMSKDCSIDIPVPVMPCDPTEKQLNPSSETPAADPSVGICERGSSLKYLRMIGKARPAKPRHLIKERKISQKKDSSPEPTGLTKCHLCQKIFDIPTEGCCYYDKLRFNDMLYFCSEKFMNI